VNIKFNFYDIYGFALPGFLLLAVLWLPFGLIEHNWPDVEFSSALVGVIFAYFTGLILYFVANFTLPSDLYGGRFPSSALLDRADKTFTERVKERLAKQIHTLFGLDVSIDMPPDAADNIRKEVDRQRNDAFFLCRSALIKSKTVAYAEQFEGLYAMMRSLSAAFAVAVVYYLGWAFSNLWPTPWSGAVVLLGIVGALITFLTGKRSKATRRVIAACLLGAAFASGHYLGQSIVGTSEHRNILLAAAVFSFFACERSYAGYKTFAVEFVKAVYRDFINYEKANGGGNANLTSM